MQNNRKLNIKSMLRRILCLTEGMKTNKYTGTRSLTLRYKKNNQNREIMEYVNVLCFCIYCGGVSGDSQPKIPHPGAKNRKIIQIEVSTKYFRDKSTKAIAANCQEPMQIT